MKNILGVNSPLIEGGSPTIYSELPWHVGLYVKNDSNQWEQRCGGSLISLHIVVTGLDKFSGRYKKCYNIEC